MKLNLACGPNVFPGWTNLDIEDINETYVKHVRTAGTVAGWPQEQVDLFNYLNNPASPPLELVQHDIRKPLPFDLESVQAIYFGQAIEHLNPIYEIPKVIEECWRVLKPGGLMRITTPDLSLLLSAHADGDMVRFSSEQPEWFAAASNDDQLSYMMFGASGPHCTRDNYEGHYHIYTPQTLRALMERNGFRWLGTDKSPVFADTIDKGLSHSMAVEVQKL